MWSDPARSREPDSDEWSIGNPYQVLLRRIKPFDWTCGSRPPNLILHREATALTKTEAWDRILTAFKENFRLISWPRLIENATPVAGVLEGKGVKSHAKSEGVYCND